VTMETEWSDAGAGQGFQQSVEAGRGTKILPVAFRGLREVHRGTGQSLPSLASKDTSRCLPATSSRVAGAKCHRFFLRTQQPVPHSATECAILERQPR
jgi:hypothetical protein